MGYKLTWYAAEEVLYLSLSGSVSAEELREINEKLTATLDGTPRKISLMLDVSELMAGYSTVDSLRATQTYRDHSKLETIIGIANNKLNRLITLLAFNLSRADFIQFDSTDKAHNYMFHRGLVRDTHSTNPIQ